MRTQLGSYIARPHKDKLSLLIPHLSQFCAPGFARVSSSLGSPGIVRPFHRPRTWKAKWRLGSSVGTNIGSKARKQGLLGLPAQGERERSPIKRTTERKAPSNLRKLQTKATEKPLGPEKVRQKSGAIPSLLLPNFPPCCSSWGAHTSLGTPHLPTTPKHSFIPAEITTTQGSSNIPNTQHANMTMDPTTSETQLRTMGGPE